MPRSPFHALPALILALACGRGSDPQAPPPTIASFQAEPAVVRLEESTRLLAQFSEGSGLVTPGNLALASGVPLQVWPVRDTTYTLTVNGAGGATSRQVSVTVLPAVNPWTPTGLPDPDPLRMKADLEALADPALEGRLTGQPGCIAAAAYIADRMRAIGLSPLSTPGASAFHMTYTIASRGITSSNVAGYIPGVDPVLKDEMVVFSAHYDHIGRRSGRVVPGANDNASGTAGILETARLLAASRPPRTLVFLAVSGEEMGLYGSLAFVEAPPFPRERIVADINLDMIGRGQPGQYHILPSTLPGRVTTLVKQARWAASFHAIPLSGGMDRYFSASDHYSFAQRGIPTLFLHDGEATDYHTPTDTADRIDYVKMAGFVKLARDVGHVVARGARPTEVPEAEFLSWTWAPTPGMAYRRWEGFLPPDPAPGR